MCTLFSVFSVFCITSFGDCTLPQHQETTGRFDTSRFDTNLSSEILGEYLRSITDQVRGTIYT